MFFSLSSSFAYSSLSLISKNDLELDSNYATLVLVSILSVNWNLVLEAL